MLVAAADAISAWPDGLPLLALADGPAGIRVANPALADQRAIVHSGFAALGQRTGKLLADTTA